MPRELFSFADDAVRRLIGILFDFRPTALSTVTSSGLGLGSGLGRTSKTADEFSDVNLFAAMWTFHVVKISQAASVVQFILKVAHYQTLGTLAASNTLKIIAKKIFTSKIDFVITRTVQDSKNKSQPAGASLPYPHIGGAVLHTVGACWLFSGRPV